MENRNDAQLVQSTLDGNRVAFGILSQRYYGMAMRVAYRMVGQYDIAHDLTQESLLQAFLSLQQLRSPSRFRAWLYGITVNVCRDYLRRYKSNPISFVSLAGGIYIADDQPSPEELMERIELRRKIQQAIEQLTDENRAVVLLYYYESFSILEIAEILEISKSAVKTRLYKARQQLKRYLTALLPTLEQDHIGEKKMIPVTVVDVMSESLEGASGQQFYTYQVVLFDEDSRRALVIWIGEPEAIMIANGISRDKSQQTYARPITQQFIMNLIQASGATVETIVLSKLENDIYYASLRLKTDSGQISEVDARPSDALALAVWHDVPIFADPDVWNMASLPLSAGLKATQKGVNEILERLREKGEARMSSSKWKQDDAKQATKDRATQLKELAQTVIDKVFE